MPTGGQSGDQLQAEALALRQRVAELEAAQTRHLQTIQALECRLHFYETLMDVIPSPLFYKDAGGVYRECNTAFAEQVLGLPKERIIGRTIDDLAEAIPPDLAAIYRRQDQQLLARPGTQVYGAPVQCADGERHYFTFMKASLDGGEGEPAGIVGVMLDVTERKRIEDDLRASEERYRRLVETSPDAIGLVDLDGKMVMCNRQMAVLHGVDDPADLIGIDVFEYVAEGDRTQAAQDMLKTFETGDLLSVAYDVLRHDGSRVPVELHASLVRDADGAPCGFIAVLRDVSQRQQADQELRASERKFRRVIEESADSIVIADPQGRILEWNRAQEQISGLKREDVLGRPLWDVLFEMGPEEDRTPAMYERIKAANLQLLRTGQVPWPGEKQECTIQRPDGSRRWAEVRVSTIPTGAGYLACSISRDITDRKRMEAALRASEERYRNLTEVVSDYVYSVRVSPGGEMISDWVSDTFAEITGYTHEEILAAGGWRALFHPDDLPLIQARAARLLSGQPDVSEFRIITRSGAVRWLRDHARPIWDEAEGRVVRFYGAAQDVTDARHAQEALQENERFLSGIFDAVQDGLLVLDRDLTILRTNRWYSEQYGPAETLIGRKCYQVLEGRDTLCEECPSVRVLATGQTHTAVMHRPHDGPDARWIEMTAYPLHDGAGEVIGVIEYAKDITRRRRAELERIASAAKFERLVAYSLDAIVLCDEQGIVVEWNPSQEEMTGLKRADALGRPIWDVLLAVAPPESRTPENHRRIKAQIEHGLRTGEVPLWGQYVERRAELPDGSRRIIQSVAFPIKTAAGYMIGNISRDVTEQRRAEQQATELTVERERLKVLKRLISDISHDLKTPITTIRLSLYLLERATSPEQQATQRQVLKAQVAHLQSLLEDLLSIARLDRLPELELAPMDLNALVASVAQSAQGIAAQRAHTLDRVLGRDVPPVTADADRLRRALTNLVTNALNYTPDGGRITLRTYCQDSFVVIEVQDNGIGIGVLDLPHIFDPFYRADPARNSDKGGMGLGLSIAYKIVEAHQGTIEVESKPGVGSVFRILLPV